jgi:hypothetical protein
MSLQVNEADHISTRSEISRTISIGQYETADISPTSEILATTLASNGSRKIICYDTTGPSGKLRTLWQAASRRPETNNQNDVTSLLPLELDLIIEGYGRFLRQTRTIVLKWIFFLLGDGRIRQTSFMRMCGRLEKSPALKKVSEPALSGYITGLHLVRNSRTKERFIVGGADDGSVAFWTIEYV